MRIAFKLKPGSLQFLQPIFNLPEDFDNKVELYLVVDVDVNRTVMDAKELAQLEQLGEEIVIFK